MRKDIAAYWVTTVLFCAVMIAGAIVDLLRAEPQRMAMEALGYPIYLLTVLGIAKLLGVIAVLAPSLPQLKEWAYAGFTFLLVGAASSHAFVGDPIPVILIPLGVLALVVASYKLRPASRRTLAHPMSGAWTA